MSDCRIRTRGKDQTKSAIPADKRIWQADDRAGLDYGQTREVETFQYDGDGNLLERSSNARGKRDFTYGRGDKLLQKEKTRYIYDAVGNLIEKQSAEGAAISYSYDNDNQLISVAAETGGRVQFKYDAFGRRTAKITDAGQTGFVWDGDVLLAENKDSQLAAEYVHEGFVPLAKIKNSQIETYHTDYLGTPKEVTNEQGEIVWQGVYDEYGKVNAVKNQTEQNIRFQGQYEDAETGLFYNRFRYYDADSCRYINQDPIGLYGDYNLYDYCQNPTAGIDPFGLEDWGKLLTKLKGPKPPGMPNPHAHHIVFKKGKPSQQADLAISKGILEKHGIDWYKGKENLVWAPNKNHSDAAARTVREALQEADKKGTRKAVEETLEDLGKKFANDDIC